MQSATSSAMDLEPIKDNLDNRSVCSSVCSSMKNAELIMAAFSSNQLSLTIEEETGESEKTSKSSEVSPSQSSSISADTTEKNSNISPDKDCSINNINEYINDDKDDEVTSENPMSGSENQREEDSSELMNSSAIQQSGYLSFSDLLDETIANVACGSISKATSKVIAKKQKLMMKKSKTQEKNYYKLKKLREKEIKKKTLARLEKLRKMERERLKQVKKEAKKNSLESKDNDKETDNSLGDKKKRYRRTKVELMKFRESQLALKNAKLEKKAAKLKSTSNEQPKSTKQNGSGHISAELPQKKKYKKKFPTINTFDENLRKRKVKLIEQQPQKPEERVLKKRGPKPKIKPQAIIKAEPEDPELIYTPATDTFPNGLNHEETDGELDMSVSIMQRTCLVCNCTLHQDELIEHCSSHFKESSRCPQCDKNSTNYSNFLTHLLSHLQPQFYCSNCDKWFRQHVVFKKHKKECIRIEISTARQLESNRKTSIKQEKSLKRKATHEALTTELSTIDQQENKRTRRIRKVSMTSSTASSSSKTLPIEIKQEPVVVKQEPVVVKRRQGRPPKNRDAIVVKKEPEEKKMAEKKRSKLSATYTDFQASEPELDDNHSKKTLRPRDKSNKTKSNPSKASIKAEKIVRRKSDRLFSTSSAISSSSSSNGQKTKKSINDQLKYESDNSPMNSNEFGDNISDQMDGIDDIVVSEFEMDQDQTENFDSNSLPDESKSNSLKSDFKTLTALNTNLNLTGTYKVKIQLRRPSNNSNSSQVKQKENTDVTSSTGSLKDFQNPQTPSKIINNVYIPSVIKLQATPSKQETNNPLNNQNITNSTSNSHTFECPECDKKFVSYYGLFQHYDQHPNLAVSCSSCQITFENHQALCVHNTKLHPEFLSEFNEFKSSRQQAELSKSNQEVSKKADTAKSANNYRGNGVKQSLNFSGKSKSQTNDLTSGDMIIPGVINPNINDLSALPSIMTRTSRLTNGNSNEKNGLNTISNAALVKTAAAISNHNLIFKTTGFADLSFIDFSCMNFPRIAQNYCELLPRKLPTNSETFQQQIQPLHNYSCKECGFFFPCKASLKLHKMKKQLASSKLEKSENSIVVVKKNITKSRCPLFMTNSKSMCYEKCLDEIIGRIEEKIERQTTDKSLSDFLNIFGLIEANSLPHFKTDFFSSTAFLTNSTGKQQQPKKEEEKTAPREEEEEVTIEDFDSDQLEEQEIIISEHIESQTEDDEEYSYYDEDEKESKFATLKFSKPVDPKLANGNVKKPSFTSGMNTNQKSGLKNLISPPPLYKAPAQNFSTAIFTSAANSSILANASGMNNSLIKKNMPKLHPATINNTSNFIDNTNSTNSASSVALMPKLIPTTGQSPRNINRSLPLKPPQLVKSGTVTAKVPTTQRPVGRPPNSQRQSNSIQINQSISSTKSSPKNAKNTNKNPESHSLKCKFCFQIFEGQPEFFQHVIKSHPKMLEQRLNRSNSVPNQDPKSPGNTSAKRPGRPPITTSNGSSNHSTSSASSSSNASKKDSKP